MIAPRSVVLFSLLCIACAAEVVAQGCEGSGGLQFVCGPKNAEDLVLVSGTQWSISSGMAEGAGFYWIDSRDGAWSGLQPQAPRRTRRRSRAV